jgi:hypothetical protein
MLRGYDIDGTLTTGLVPIEPYVVISGRTMAEYDDTVKRLAANSPVYIRCSGLYGDQQDAGRFKANIINLLKIEEFYEDDPVQISIIRALAPICKVVRVYPDGRLLE